VRRLCREFRPTQSDARTHFRLLLIGYFGGIDSERGIAWRTADSLASAAIGRDVPGLSRAAGAGLGIETPTRVDLARLDRKRPKKGRNTERRHPHDPDARITKMKDGRTHLAHKAEHAVDLETGAIVVADKGYHSNQILVDLAALDLRTYIAEPDRRRWQKKTEARDAVHANRRRIRRARGRALNGSEASAWNARARIRTKPEGYGVRICGDTRNILKRLFIHIGGFNLGS
jgi:hypothetical protein